MSVCYRYVFNVKPEVLSDANIYRMFDALPEIYCRDTNIRIQSREEFCINANIVKHLDENTDFWIISSMQHPNDRKCNFGCIVRIKDKQQSRNEEVYFDRDNSQIHCLVDMYYELRDDDSIVTPMILKYLVENDCLYRNGPFRFSSRPLRLRYDDAKDVSKVINGEVQANAPLILVKEDVADSVNLKAIQEKGKGLFTILLEDDPDFFDGLAELIDEKVMDKITDNDISILTTGSKLNRYGKLEYDDEGETIDDEKTIIGLINDYYADVSLLNFKEFRTVRYTYEELLADVFEDGQRIINKSQEKYDKLIEENTKLKARLGELPRMAVSSFAPNTILPDIRENGVPLLFTGKEKQLYQGEIKDMVLMCLKEYRDRYVKDDTRRADILDDILNSNGYQKICEKKRQEIKDTLTTIDNPSSADSQKKFRSLGFEVKSGSHLKLRWCGDKRYTLSVASTPSDVNFSKEMVREILEKCL